MERVAQCQEQETTSDNLIGKVNITIEMIGRLMAHVSDHIPTIMTMTQDQFAQTQHQVNAQAAQVAQMQNHLNTRALQMTQVHEQMIEITTKLEQSRAKTKHSKTFRITGQQSSGEPEPYNQQDGVQDMEREIGQCSRTGEAKSPRSNELHKAHGGTRRNRH